MINKMCETPLGIILKPMMTLLGLSNQVDQIQEAIEKGNPIEIAVRFVQVSLYAVWTDKPVLYR